MQNDEGELVEFEYNNTNDVITNIGSISSVRRKEPESSIGRRQS